MKIYLSNLNESWVVDRFREDWYKNNQSISTEKISKADIVWIISPWTWKKINKKYLKNKKVLCSIYHIDFEKFNDIDKDEFYQRDQFVDEYHVISLKTKQQLRQLTSKKITSIPFWIDQNLFFEIKNKAALREKYGFKKNDFIIGSFQRDTEGSDLSSPKLIKGPDIFLEITKDLVKSNKEIKILLTGKRRQFLINNFRKYSVPYKYYEMVDIEIINELYNILDLYIVTSRIEGGPQAILECAITKTPILSTDVGVASEILHEDSIFKVDSFDDAKTNIMYAFKQVQEFKIPIGMKKHLALLKSIYEN
jgi:glycosyltransferase involved in cell wall biosynthesis